MCRIRGGVIVAQQQGIQRQGSHCVGGQGERLLVEIAQHGHHLVIQAALVGKQSRVVCKQQAQSLGVADRVIFVGAVPPAEVPRYYALGDVFVSASTSEAQGLTYIEAMAAGLPLLCHADPCLDALVREGETGWAYHTPAELAARAAALPKGHQLAAMRQNARRAVQPYTKEQFGLSVVRLYAAALGRKHAARSAAGGNVA